MARHPMIAPGYSIRHGLLVAVQVVLLTALCGFVLLLADRYNRRYDLTPLKTFVLSEQAKRIAAGVRKPVQVKIFYNGQESGRRRQIADLLDQFAAASPLISYSLYDLDRTPGLAKKYNISSYNTGVVESDGLVEPLAGVEELDIASALLKISRARPRTLCFLTGHGEHSPLSTDDRTSYGEVAKALERENFAIRTFELLPAGSELQTCDVVVVPGPSKDFVGDEAERLRAFVRSGGKVFLLADPQPPDTVVRFLREHGIQVGGDLIVDERNRLYGADAFMARVPIFDQDTFRKRMELAAVFPLAQSVTPTQALPPNISVALLALSSPDSWARVDGGVVRERTPRFRREKDKNGPLPVAVMVSVRAPGDGADQPGPSGKIAVFGDSDFATNFYLNLMGNKDLFMSTLGVLTEEEELIAVRQKGRPMGSISPIYVSAHQGRVIFWITVVLVPVGFLAVGIAIAAWRRKRGS